MRSVKVFQNECIPSSQMNLIFQSRTIWRDLATWIRAYLAIKHGGLGDVEAIREKLDELRIKSVNIFSIVFGEQLADQYVRLSSDFNRILDSLIDAQISGDTEMINEYTKQLYENADQIAAFLSQINPYWVESKWKDLLYQLNQKTIEESATFQNGQFRENIDIFDSILKLTSIIGDYYSQGLVNYLNFSSR